LASSNAGLSFDYASVNVLQFFQYSIR